MARWIECIHVKPPSFILINLCPVGTHTGTGLERKQIASIQRLLNACKSVSSHKGSCVLYLVGSQSLPTFEVPEMKELGEQMFRHLVRWANLGVEMPDGTLTKTTSRVWCSAQVLPDLSGFRTDKAYATDSNSDLDGARSVSPGRRARGRVFRVGLILLFQGTVSDSTRVQTRLRVRTCFQWEANWQ